MSVLRFKAGDTYPPLAASLGDETGWLAVTAAAAIDVTAVGRTGDPPDTITGTCQAVSETTITATLTTGSPILADVSSFADIKVGTTLVGEGIPLAAQVGAYDTVAQTIDMVVGTTPAPATAAASDETITLGRGQVTYSWEAGDTTTPDTYETEYLITWSTGQYQRVPNAETANPTFIIDPALSTDPA